MKKIITYGTFDLLHSGHINILKSAKALGDYLVVGVTSEQYDLNRGKLNIHQSLAERIENVKKTGLADKIIVEERLGQKIEDIQKYQIDTFVIGSDWNGKFDYLNEYCQVVYLPRTKGVSSTELRNKKWGILKLGIIGHGRIARRFMEESKYVSGVEVVSVFGIVKDELEAFAKDFEIQNSYLDLESFYESVDAVYIATPHLSHFEYVQKSLQHGKHVLCEKPLSFSTEEVKSLMKLATEKNLILFEAIKTAYCPGFQQLISIAKSGIIGSIKNVSAAFTKLIYDRKLREYDPHMGGGAFNELASYPLLAVIKILGLNYTKTSFISYIDDKSGVDLFSKAEILYPTATASLAVGIGVKQEGELIIAGTNGYIYVPAPWWKTNYFEIRFENSNKEERYYQKFEGDGLRYEIADFLNSIYLGKPSYKFSNKESLAISGIFEDFHRKLKNQQVDIIK